METWVKNIKSYATIPKVYFPQEREGYLTAKSPNILAKIQHGLTIHKINLPLQAKFGFSNSPFLVKIPVNQAKFAQFAHKSCELHEICTKIHPHLVHYFQISDHQQRTPGNWSESTRFCAIRPQLPRIT